MKKYNGFVGGESLVFACGGDSGNILHGLKLEILNLLSQYM